MVFKRFTNAARLTTQHTNRRTVAGAAVLFAMILAAGTLLGCASRETATEDAAQEAVTEDGVATPVTEEEETSHAADGSKLQPLGLHLEDDYRTTYEVFVYSFADGNGDGIGDLKGLSEKLDYINDGDDDSETDLGCNEIWLMPIFPSPTYHKYDATDYMAIDPAYGTMEDFDALLTKCHERDVRVILDLAVNHTSREHPWFTEAAAYLKGLPEGTEPDAEACPYVQYYNFQRKQATGYEQLPGTDWYYEARFWSGMPDLNLDNEMVREEIEKIVSFWLNRGVDGFRLDAVTSYYTSQGDQNTAFIAWLTNTVKTINPKAYLVGECWEGQNTYADYYDSGIDSLFDFEFAGQEGVISSVVNGRKKAAYYVDRVAAEEELYAAHNPDYVNAPFYTNHDMARSAGYYLYDDGTKCKFAQALNLLQTGNAFLYYGEELGMKGSGKDENKRLPMMWSDDEQEDGRCAGPLDAEDVKQKFGPVSEQTKDPNSILSYVRHAIRLRMAYPVIARGRTTKVEALCEDTVGAFVRSMPGTGKAGASQGDGSEWTSVLVLFNAGEEPVTVDLAAAEAETGLTFTGTLDSLTVDTAQPVTREGNKVHLPGFGIAVISVQE